MRLLSFRAGGRESFGVLIDREIVELADEDVRTLRDALATWGLQGIRERTRRESRRIPIGEIHYLQPITDPEKILAVGLNYHLHAEEAGLAIPKYPSVFARFPGSQVGHDEPVWRPRLSEQFDYEAELAVVIGKRCRAVEVGNAMDAIAGYGCFAENSVRDYQRHTNQATPGKNFQRSGAFGPWIVTPDEAGDPRAMTVVGRLNDREMQRDSVANMIFSIPEIIAYISSFTDLVPGDVIVTGTPAGVGFTKKPPLYLKPGDRFEVEIAGVGILRNSVIDEPRQEQSNA
ncbi:MAG: fumarylacetoacetate hydrolase family protein [Burkholderiaceae bacterium]